MARLIIETDDGHVVYIKQLQGHMGNATWQDLLGIPGYTGMGALGRAVSDAQKIERGIDPERPSEKVMRLLAEREQSGKH